MKADVAIAGGGLAGSLIAWRLREARPDLDVVIVDQGATLGGNHTWSFHDSDLDAVVYDWIKPLIVHHWPSQQVRFPAYERSLATGYNSTTSERLHDVVSPVVGERFIGGARIAAVSASGIALEDDGLIEAEAVIDARGQRDSAALTIGFQKFLGQVVRFAEPHGLDAPIIMDATVPQTDGYRFVYVLPFADDACLVEDTYYADGSELDLDLIRKAIADYCGDAGWTIAEIIKEEVGVLPIALAGDIEAHLAAAPDGVSLAGLGAGLFHPLTGYSLPDAAALAHAIAGADDVSGPSLSKLTRNYAIEKWRERSFYRLLSRMLYHAAKPEQRYTVLQRFYRLSTPLIERFYAGTTTTRDKARVLIGKPPVNIAKAVECVDEERWRSRVEGAFAAGCGNVT